MLVGAFLFVATGALAIQHHDPITNDSARRDTGLAMGSIAIIDGIVMLGDALWLVKKVHFTK
jgi:hypothetical protein